MLPGLLKSTGTVFNLFISILSTSAFKLLYVSTHAALFKSAFVA